MTPLSVTSYVLIITIATAATAANVALRTRQGIIHGRATQSSIEYLGYEKLSGLLSLSEIVL